MRGVTTLLILLAATALSGCGDDDPSAPASPSLSERIAGSWSSRNEDFGGLTLWARFDPHGSLLSLAERDNGVRSLHESAWTVEDEARSRITIDGRGYTIAFANGDSTLTTVSDHEDDTVVYARVPAIPDPESWLGRIEVLEDLDPPDPDPTELAWDGAGIWFPGRFAGTPLRRMDPAAGLAVDSSLAVPHAGWSLEYAGGDFWIDEAGGGRIYRVDGETGAVTESPDYAASGPIHGVADPGDGTLWVASGTMLRRLVLRTGAVANTFEAHAGVYGLEIAGGALYAALGGRGLARIEGPPWRVAAQWSLPDRSFRGIAFDGASWWIYLIDARAEITTRLVRARLL